MTGYTRNVPRENAPPCRCIGCRIRLVCDVFATGYVVGFGAYALAGVELLPSPFGIIVCALLGAAAVFWIVR